LSNSSRKGGNISAIKTNNNNNNDDNNGDKNLCQNYHFENASVYSQQHCPILPQKESRFFGSSLKQWV